VVASHSFSQLFLLWGRTPRMELPKPEAETLAKARALRLGESMLQKVGFKGCRRGQVTLYLGIGVCGEVE
jgi:hypothetical protein